MVCGTVLTCHCRSWRRDPKGELRLEETNFPEDNTSRLHGAGESFSSMGTEASINYKRKSWKLVGGICIALVVGAVAIAFYSRTRLSPSVKRDRFVKSARAYLSRGKTAEAIVEFANALKEDPAAAEIHHELGLALLAVGDGRAAFSEFYRAVDLQPKMVKSRFQIGQLYLLVKDLPHAKEQLAYMRAQDANTIESHLLAVEIDLAADNFDSALGEIQEAIKDNQGMAGLYLILGNINMRKGDVNAAETAYRKALELDPKAHKVRTALADLYLNLGKRDKAEDELLAAIAADPNNEEPVHKLGNFYSITAQTDRFERLFSDLLKKNPNSIAAKKRLAELWLVKGDLQRAKSYAQEIMTLEPNGTDGRYLRGRIYLAEKDYAKANTELGVVATKAPQSADAAYYYGIAQLGLGYMQQARSAFLRATVLQPNWMEPHVELAKVYLANGDNKIAGQESERVLREQSENLDALHVAANAAAKRGELEQALTLFRKIQKLDPRNPTVHISSGEIYLSLKQFDLAISEYETAVKLDPERIDALTGLAQVYMQKGNTQTAFDRVNKQLTISKDKGRIHQLLAQMSLGMKDYTKAIQHLEKTLELNPSLVSAYSMIGNAYLAQNKFDEAIEQYQKAIQKKPSEIPTRMLLGILHDQKKDYAKANEYYRKILDIDENFLPAANNLAWNYAEHGKDLDTAFLLANKTRSREPENPEFADTLGWILYKKGSYKTALLLLKESNEKFEYKNPAVLYHLGMTQYLQGEKSSARETLTKALSLDRHFPGADDAEKTLVKLGAKSDS